MDAKTEAASASGTTLNAGDLLEVKRHLVLGSAVFFLFVLLAVMAFWPPEPVRRDIPNRPPAAHPGRRSAPEFVRPREFLRDASSQSTVSYRLAAAGLRAKARTEPGAMEDLIRELLSPETPLAYRSVVALVLGTIDSDRAQEALLEALTQSSNPEWTALLLHALGADKSSQDDEIFDLPDTPYVYELAGLRLRIQTNLTRQAIRLAIEPYLSNDAVEVRRAALRAMLHSAEHQDVRTCFSERLSSEPNDELRAGSAYALAQWLSGPVESAQDRNTVAASLLDVARRVEETAVRFRVEEPLRRASLTLAEVETLTELARDGAPSQQQWSLSILRSKTEVSGARLENVCTELTRPDVDPKVREYAVGVLGQFRTAASRTVLIRLLQQDPAWHVRAAAARCLSSEKAELQRAMESDSDERVRQAAREALRR